MRDGSLSARTSRILVVDADDDTRLLWRQALVQDGCVVLEASDGREALTKVFDDVPSLVITELRLPFVDGLSLCEILRQDRMTANVPVLIVTTETRPAELHRARQHADAVLTKPTQPDGMLAEVKRLIERSDDGREILSPTRNAALHVDEAKDRLTRSGPGRRAVLVKSFARFATNTPPVPPRDLTCPSCDRRLKYECSYIGGVSERHPEQWDYYVCLPSCGSYQYRQRTRTLRRVNSVRDGPTSWG
jgi:DNA-binding response OmpR family regulator